MRPSATRRRTLTPLAGGLITLLLLVLPLSAASNATPPSKPIPATYFGLHAQRIVVPPRLQMPAAPFPTVPFESFRMWSIPDWFQINGSPGQRYNWMAIDRFLDLANERAHAAAARAIDRGAFRDLAGHLLGRRGVGHGCPRRNGIGVQA